MALRGLLETLSRLAQLKLLNMWDCRSLEALPPSVGEPGSLQEVEFDSYSVLRTLPDTPGGPAQLKTCSSLEALLPRIGELRRLQELELNGCSVLRTPPGTLGALGELERLSMANCWSLGALPPSVDELGSLEVLWLGCCSALRGLLDTPGGLAQLKRLDMQNCSSWKALPPRVSELASLLQEPGVVSCSVLEGSIPTRVQAMVLLKLNVPWVDVKLTGYVGFELGGCSQPAM